MTETIFSFSQRGFDFAAVDTGNGDALVTIRQGNEIVRQFKFPAYKVYNIPAHANDIVDGLLEESDRGLRAAGSDGLGGNAYKPALATEEHQTDNVAHHMEIARKLAEPPPNELEKAVYNKEPYQRGLLPSDFELWANELVKYHDFAPQSELVHLLRRLAALSVLED